MITEPEPAGDPGSPGDPEGPGAAAIPRGTDIVTRAESSGARSPRRRAWRWALGGAAAAGAVWAAVLHGTGYGARPAPDLHGFRLTENPCTGRNLRPLTGALPTRNLFPLPAEFRAGPALEHLTCSLSADHETGDGWTTVYDITLTVDLHKKTDPRAEFEDTSRGQVPPTAASGPGVDRRAVADTGVTRPVPDLGDQAFLTTGPARQILYVLRGGAVLSLSVDAANVWEGASAPATGAGDTLRPAFADTSALGGELAPTMRHLMSVLAS